MNDKKTSVRTLTMLALLVAMSIVFSRVLSISTGFVRFNLGSLPVLLAAVVFGPGAGFAVGAVADIIGGAGCTGGAGSDAGDLSGGVAGHRPLPARF
jgi:ECF transporter S component (folate family)